jgi:putative tryptophan/tyrosine transport system ATP-binding protein
MICLDRVGITFNAGTALETAALRELNLEIPDGQFVTVIGSNGAGKSTLLNVLSGEILTDVGRVIIGDRDVTTWKSDRRAKLVARVFQNPLMGSCADLTVEENLALAARRGKSRGLTPALGKAFRSHCQEQLASLGLGLEKRLGDRMGLLSGGQRQAVSLLMAKLAPNQILLLDEHTAALDPKTAEAVMRLSDRMIRELGLTTLMVTHSMKQALQWGDRTIMLHEGRIVFDLMGEARSQLTVQDLLQQFEQLQGHEVSDDSLLLG